MSHRPIPQDVLDFAEREVAEIDSAALADSRTELFATATLTERDRCLRLIAEQRCERGTPWDLALVTAMNAIKPGSAVWEARA